MIYAISDLHGCIDKYRSLMKMIKFGPDDILYVLGDVIDRGPDGFNILLDMAQRPNVINLMGNHEAMAIRALSHVMCMAGRSGTALSESAMDDVGLWFYNGGQESLENFFSLDIDEKRIVWDYLTDMPLYQEVTMRSHQFVLVHGGLGNFSPDRPLDDYEQDEILWCRPDLDKAYYPDKYVVFGHTPVQFLNNSNGPAKIYRAGKYIDIDCGCVFSGRLGCLCLDNLEEIYV